MKKKEKTMTTRDDITETFINDLREETREEFWVFLMGFAAAWELSGAPELPCDQMDIFDRYMTGVIKARIKDRSGPADESSEPTDDSPLPDPDPGSRSRKKHDT